VGTGDHGGRTRTPTPVKISLSLEELLVMKALARRPRMDGYARFKTQSLDATRVSQLVGELHRVGLVEAKRTADGEWHAGPLTEGGSMWLKAYGMTIRD
jgi:hypothetical protein